MKKTLNNFVLKYINPEEKEFVKVGEYQNNLIKEINKDRKEFIEFFNAIFDEEAEKYLIRVRDYLKTDDEFDIDTWCDFPSVLLEYLPFDNHRVSGESPAGQVDVYSYVHDGKIKILEVDCY